MSKKRSFWNWFRTSEEPWTPQPILHNKGIEIIKNTPKRIEPLLENYNRAVIAATAENLQDRQMLYSFYWQAMNLDPWVSALINKRLENVLEKRVHLQVGDEPLDTGEFFKSPTFKKFLTDILLTKFWGFSVFEFERDMWNDQPWFNYSRLPNVNFNPYLKEVLLRPTDTKGTPLSVYDNVLFSGDVDDLGELLQITRLYIEKSNSNAFRLRYAELASENFVIESYKNYDQNTLEELNQAFEQRGVGNRLQKPEDIGIELHNQSSSQQNQLFKDLIDDYKKELSILILGQTMTTQDGSSRSQAEVHQEEQDNKMIADIEYIEDFLNFEFIEFLPLWFDIPTTDAKFILDTTNEKKIRTQIGNVKLLQELGMTFTEEELREKFKDLL